MRVWWVVVVGMACGRGNRPFLLPVIIDLQNRMKYLRMHLHETHLALSHSINAQLIINLQLEVLGFPLSYSLG